MRNRTPARALTQEDVHPRTRAHTHMCARAHQRTRTRTRTRTSTRTRTRPSFSALLRHAGPLVVDSDRSDLAGDVGEARLRDGEEPGPGRHDDYHARRRPTHQRVTRLCWHAVSVDPPPRHVTCAARCDLALLGRRVLPPVGSDGELRRRHGSAGLLRAVSWGQSH